MSRNGYKINRTSYDFVRSERVDWIDRFADKIEQASKTAVQVAREREQMSIQDQINSIISRRPVHATVEDIVQSYHERTGLDKYLNSRGDLNNSGKVAFSLSEHQDVFADYPAIRDKIMSFAKNKVDTNYGQVSIPAIQNEIMSQFRADGVNQKDVENESVAKFINDLIVAAQQQTPPADLSGDQLGKGVGVVDVDDNDETNTDFYRGLMPSTD